MDIGLEPTYSACPGEPRPYETRLKKGEGTNPSSLVADLHRGFTREDFDLAGDDVVGLHVVVLAAAQPADDAGVSALGQGGRMGGDLIPGGDAMPFGAFLARIALAPEGLRCDGEVQEGLAAVEGLGAASAATKPFNSTLLVYVMSCFSFSARLSGTPEVRVAAPQIRSASSGWALFSSRRERRHLVVSRCTGSIK